ncbi:conserved Plasmodium protein, unknown function [Plasmodium knowlesi strain H]|uniref:RRM domain-containing protein n=2 Tax=Plasmodium knowlesi TaxID=5850 RepID=B3L129_PLAKH|nr:conserved Plasmodium protein, unknown function [Plasmodium knowlesi strain H]OTN67965.1 Uncharacterized protein PKNOH_S04344700 [Plasmodium knowlesi]CAA9990240.1 conserved Plasmodium protein, unknown function [Plasmodium knowlesi strain H]VVS79714.1 conserved Plasmodium protein, unknown function [Plasmodium knowlesi strain H]|eukprot:XP_002258061.1 hypothetical protein, conserved in Plasmodium species [Plasmodium knowlesi strain H]
MQRRKRLHTVLQTYYITNWICVKPKVFPPPPFSSKWKFLINKKNFSVFSKLAESSLQYGTGKDVDATRGDIQKGETEKVITPNGEAPSDGVNGRTHNAPPQLCENTQCGHTSDVNVSQGVTDGLAGVIFSSMGEELHIGPNVNSGDIAKVEELSKTTAPMEPSEKNTEDSVNGKKKKKTKKKNAPRGKVKSTNDGTQHEETLRGEPPNCIPPMEEKKKKKKKKNQNAKEKQSKKKKENCQNEEMKVTAPMENEQTIQRDTENTPEKATQENEGENFVSKKFSKEDYYRKFELICQNSNIIMEKINRVKDICTFVQKHMSSLHFGNIYAYNNLLYEIYDKFVDGDIKKVKKLIKNYRKLVKKNLQRKIKYFEAFHKICPEEYNHVLTCLFIQSIDILKDEDISHTFNYDQVICTSRDTEGGVAELPGEEEEVEAFSNMERNVDKGEAGDGTLFCAENADTVGNAGGDGDQGESAGKNVPRANYQQRQFNPSNKIMYEMDVHFDEGEAEEMTFPGEGSLPRDMHDEANITHSINEKNFIIVYNLPIINYNLLEAELKETFSFCGEIKSMEFFSDRLKTVDINALNDEVEIGSSQNVPSTKSKKNGSKQSGNGKGGKSNQPRCSTGNKIQNSFNLNSYTQLYAIIEFFDEKSANLATSEFLRIFGIFCFNKLVYVDKCVNKNIMIITHLPFHLNIYNIFYLLLNASLLKLDVLNGGAKGKGAPKLSVSMGENCGEKDKLLDQSTNPGVPSDGNKQISSKNRKRRCEISLRNSNIRIESCDSIFGETPRMSNRDVYDYICEISKKNFLQFKKKKNIKLEAWTNDDDSGTEGKNNNFESFADFYQNQNKKMKTKKVNIHNNGRILILHFDSFTYMYDCLKKFKHIFGKKNHMIFSVNLRRCIYRNGAIRDCVQVKDGRIGRGLNLETKSSAG